MTENKIKQTCPHCRQVSGIEIIYGSVDTLSETLRNVLKDGDVVLGGAYRKWDWEEELINTRCLRCKHEWHAGHSKLPRRNLRHEYNLIHAAAIPVAGTIS
jgi:hypothetical protein